jgi:hypothetical protein
MTVDSSKIRAYSDGLVAVSGMGVLSPTLPTDPTTSLDPAVFTDVGTITSDGITEATSQDSTDVFAWQGNALIASLPGQYVKTFQLAAAEVTLTNLGLQYSPSSTITQTSYGVSIVERPTTRDSRAWVFHGKSGVYLQRVVVPLGEISERGEVLWSSEDITVYAWTVKCFTDSNGAVAYRYLYEPSLAIA